MAAGVPAGSLPYDPNATFPDPDAMDVFTPSTRSTSTPSPAQPEATGSSFHIYG